MFDVVLETIRAVVMLGVIVFLVNAGRDRHTSSQNGWSLITVGFLLLFFGSALDITDNFESLNRFVVIGDTEAEAFLEKVVGYLGGFICVAVGLYLWVPSVQRLSEEVSRRKRSELALRESETSLKEAAHIAKLGHFIWDDVENRCVYCDEELARILGVTVEDFMSSGASFDEDLAWVHPDDRARYRTVVVEEALQHRGPVSFDYRIVRRDGEIRHIHERGKPVLDKSGSVIRTIGTMQDITERKQAEAALQAAHDSLEERVKVRTAELETSNVELQWEITRRRETEHARRRSEARLMAILENAPVEIYLKDVEGRYVLINRECERLWGVTREEVKGKLPEQVDHPGDFAQLARAHDLAVLSSGEVIEQEHEILIDDNLHTINFVKFPIRDAAGEIAGLGAIATDVTQSKMLQQIKNEFISSVSHELRTPMTSVLGALGLVQGGAAGRLPEKAQSMIDIAHKNCNRLVRLLNDILDIEKIESGNANFEMCPLELGPLARDAIETVAAYADEHDVEVRLVEDVHLAKVKANGDRLIQVLTNLLSNAIKFSPQGSTVELRISWADHSGRVSVTDRGPGIPEAFRDRVFERFTQADTADNRRRSGTGLGLSICKLIINEHAGKIAFDTKIGTGTTFYFDLPEWAVGEDYIDDPKTAALG